MWNRPTLHPPGKMVPSFQSVIRPVSDAVEPSTLRKLRRKEWRILSREGRSVWFVAGAVTEFVELVKESAGS
jgi:hypothetical protein